MQPQTSGSLQQEAALALRDPPLQWSWHVQQPPAAKYYSTPDRRFSTARSSTCTKRPNLAMSMTCLATSSSEILCNNRQMVLFSKKQYLHQETHPCNSPGLLSNLNQQNIMQKQTDGSLQQEAILALRDPPLQFTWPAQQPQAAKYYATTDRWFSAARSNTCTKRPTLAIHLTCSATSCSEKLCNIRQMVLCSKKQYSGIWLPSNPEQYAVLA